jgi:tyrosyl-tRNA synthetase
MPLLEGTDGVKKMSKSLGNYVGISEPPEAVFGKLMSVSDDLMWRYLELLSFDPMEKIEAKKRAVEQGGNPRDVKFDFAKEIVARFHGPSSAENAARDFVVRFSQGEIPENMPQVTVTSGSKPMAIAQILKAAGLTASTSEALRMIEQGGVRIDGEKLSDRALQLVPGKTVVLQVGKRKFARVTLA